MKNNHDPKSRREQENFIHGIINIKDEPTKQENGSGTLDSIGLDDDEKSTNTKRKFFKSRFFIHIKDYWPNYAVGFVGLLAVFYFLTMNIKLTEINKDISYLYIKTDENTRKIEKVSDDVISLREQILLFSGDLKSLNDRFSMFIELFKKNEN